MPSNEHRGLSVAEKLGTHVAEKNPEEATTVLAADREQCGVRLVPRIAQNADWIACNDLGARAGSPAEDRLCLISRCFRLTGERLRPVSRVEARPRGGTHVQRGDSADGRARGRRQDERLAKRLESQLCAVHSHDDALEDGAHRPYSIPAGEGEFSAERL
jgi:hypothetical protein